MILKTKVDEQNYPSLIARAVQTWSTLLVNTENTFGHHNIRNEWRYQNGWIPNEFQTAFYPPPSITEKHFANNFRKMERKIAENYPQKKWVKKG